MVFYSLPHVFNLRLCLGWRNGKGCLDQLSDDILVDHVFLYLNVEEVMVMRRVSKLYYRLTHNPIIWKRFLSIMKSPFPPLPPTDRYSFGNLTGLEAERLVTRAITLKSNWCSKTPTLYDHVRVAAHAEVLAMSLLPGGKYMVASVRDQGHLRYSLVVYILDRPVCGAIPLVKMPTGTKAYNLQAKYMVVGGIQGICIAYVRRYSPGGHRKVNGVDVSDLSGEHRIVDDSVAVHHECVCLHVSLSSLEALGESSLEHGTPGFLEVARAQPPPFKILAEMKSTSAALDTINLNMIANKPFLTILKHPETLLVKDLEIGTLSTLKCKRWDAYQGVPNTICNFCVIPCQKQFLVIREIPPLPPITPTRYARNGPWNTMEVLQDESDTLYSMELFDIPLDGGSVETNATERQLVELLDPGEKVLKFYLSDPGVCLQDLRLATGQSAGPPPISVFCSTTSCQGKTMQHFLVWPQNYTQFNPVAPQSRLSTIYRYSLDDGIYQTRYLCEENVFHILPGAYFSVVCRTPGEKRVIAPAVLELRSYMTPGVRDDSGECLFMKESNESQAITKVRKPIRKEPDARLKVPHDVENALRRGVMCFAWDESIGRTCFAPEGLLDFYVLDFARTPMASLDQLQHLL